MHRSAFEYLAIKLQEVELEESQVDEILAMAEAKNAPAPVAEELAEGEEGDEGSDADEADADQAQGAHDLGGEDADLSVEVGGQDMSQIEEGDDPTVQGEGGVGEQMGGKEIKMEMKKVQDAKTGVLAKLRESMAKLDFVYMFLQEKRKNTGGVAPQTKQNAEAKATGTKNLHITLEHAEYNNRISMTRSGTTPRRNDEDDDDQDLDDRSTIKNKAERLVAKKKKEEASRFDEFGMAIIPIVKDSKKK